MSALVARGLAFVAAAMSLAEGSHVLQAEGSPNSEELQLAYELTGKATVHNRSGPIKEFPRISLKSARPIVVFKMDRTGSSWFAEQLKNVGVWKKVKAEGTNNHEWCRKDGSPKLEKCVTLVHDALKYLQPKYGGLTINPFKFVCTHPDEKNGCYQMLFDNFKQMQPFSIALVRKNVVLQAASHLRARSVEEMGLCNHGFHVDRCDDEAKNYKAMVSPKTLLNISRRNLAESEQLKEMAARLAPPKLGALELSTEDFYNSESMSFTIPDKVWRYFGVNTSSPLWKQSEGEAAAESSSSYEPDGEDNNSLDASSGERSAIRFASPESTKTEEEELVTSNASAESDETEEDEDLRAEASFADDVLREMNVSFQEVIQKVGLDDSEFGDLDGLTDVQIDYNGELSSMLNRSAVADVEHDNEGDGISAATFEAETLYTNLIARHAMREGELLRNYITNFEQVREYFEENAPDLLPMVDAIDEYF